jgi:hypothetical protein
MGRGRLGLAVISSAAALLFAAPARAVELRDGTEYSVTPAGPPMCIVFPAELYDRAACPHNARPVAKSPLEPPMMALAIGSVRVGAPDSDETAIFTATRTTSDDNSRPGDLDAFARGMANQMVKSRDGAQLQGKPSASLVDVGGQSFARVTFDVDGYLGGGLAHEVAYMAWSEAGTYALSWTALATNAAAIDAIADKTAQTIHVSRPAPSHDYARGYATGRLIGNLFVPIAVAVAVAAVLLFRRKRNEPGTPKP